jgi:hypothetical protein
VDWNSLHQQVVEAVRNGFDLMPHVVTTDRTGRVDGAWITDDGTHVPVMKAYWLRTGSADARDYALRSLGGLLRAYATHPDRDPQVNVTTYDDWPAMVEVEFSLFD